MDGSPIWIRTFWSTQIVFSRSLVHSRPFGALPNHSPHSIIESILLDHFCIVLYKRLVRSTSYGTVGNESRNDRPSHSVCMCVCVPYIVECELNFDQTRSDNWYKLDCCLMVACITTIRFGLIP